MTRLLRMELFDVILAMNGAWLVNSAMIVVAAAAFAGRGMTSMSIEAAHATLGSAGGPASATLFAVALLCSGLSSSTVGTMAGQMILEGLPAGALLHLPAPPAHPAAGGDRDRDRP